MKLLAMTCCCVDVFVNTGDLLPGGNALNICADWAIRKGTIQEGPNPALHEVEIRLLGAVGNDAYGTAIRNSIDRSNHPKKRVTSTKTCSRKGSTDEDTSMDFSEARPC